MIALKEQDGFSEIRIGDVRGWVKTAKEDPFHIVEFSLVPGRVAYPAHIHDKIHEANFVLSGEVKVRIGDEEEVFGPGTFLKVPPGTPHSVVAGDVPARVLAIHSPGAEAFRLFDELGNAFTGERPDPSVVARHIADLDIRLVVGRSA